MEAWRNSAVLITKVIDSKYLKEDSNSGRTPKPRVFPWVALHSPRRNRHLMHLMFSSRRLQESHGSHTIATNSWAQVILPPQSPELLGLQARSTMTVSSFNPALFYEGITVTSQYRDLSTLRSLCCSH
ncbi:hypothetical protein AAY473_038307 [Plecturocebus cupreus]